MSDNPNLPLKVADEKLSTYLARLAPEMEKVLPKHATPERMVRMVLSEFSRIPKLAKCDSKSILNCIMVSAETGLEPGPAGLIYYIPYADKKKDIIVATPIISYKGMTELAIGTGIIKKIATRCVYEGEEFEVLGGDNECIIHKPDPWAKTHDQNTLVGVYAIAWHHDGTTQHEVMSKAEIDKIRNRSRASSDGPWVTDYLEMARKTVSKRLYKYLPKTKAVRAAYTAFEEENKMLGYNEKVPEYSVSETNTHAAQLKQRLDNATGKAQENEKTPDTVDNKDNHGTAKEDVEEKKVETPVDTKPEKPVVADTAEKEGGGDDKTRVKIYEVLEYYLHETGELEKDVLQTASGSRKSTSVDKIHPGRLQQTLEWLRNAYREAIEAKEKGQAMDTPEDATKSPEQPSTASDEAPDEREALLDKIWDIAADRKDISNMASDVLKAVIGKDFTALKDATVEELRTIPGLIDAYEEEE